jgi:hypothetical protein
VTGDQCGQRPQDKGFRLQASGIGLREGFREKWTGDSPSPLVPFDRLTTSLSLGGARKTKEKGYSDKKISQG